MEVSKLQNNRRTVEKRLRSSVNISNADKGNALSRSDIKMVKNRRAAKKSSNHPPFFLWAKIIIDWLTDWPADLLTIRL